MITARSVYSTTVVDLTDQENMLFFVIQNNLNWVQLYRDISPLRDCSLTSFYKVKNKLSSIRNMYLYRGGIEGPFI